MNSLLNDDEKRRFLEWLNVQIYSAGEMLKATESMPGVGEAMAKKFRLEQFAFTFVRDYIQNSESFTVGNP